MIYQRHTYVSTLMLSGMLSLAPSFGIAAVQDQAAQPKIVRGTITNVAGNKLEVDDANGNIAILLSRMMRG